LANLVLDNTAFGAAKSNSAFANRIDHYSSDRISSQVEIVCGFASKDSQGNCIWDLKAIRDRRVALCQIHDRGNLMLIGCKISVRSRLHLGDEAVLTFAE
jgi:hypothetical protein